MHEDYICNTLEQDIYPILSPGLTQVLRKVSLSTFAQVTEIRLRMNQPLLLVLGQYDFMPTKEGKPVNSINDSYICTAEDIHKTIQLISKNSLYAFEQDIKLGFLTVKGGHRIGLAGQAVMEEGRVKTFKNISSLNIRLAREIKGCADKIISYVVSGQKKVFNTLIISPPRCGKTTLLRDVVRLLSLGIPQLEFAGVQIGVVDERSEICACRNGMPTVDLGYRVDVLDGCRKADGLLMLIRSMSPQVVVTDELGRKEDAYAIRESLTAGVSVITTIHGKDIGDIGNRPYIGELVQNKYFDRYIILGNIPSPGTVEAIVDQQGKVLYSYSRGAKLCG